MYVITVLSTKGGVGKTSLVANLGGLYADLGVRVLLIDTDPTASLSKYYPHNVATSQSSGLVEMLREGNLKPEHVIPTVLNNLSIVISNDLLGEIQNTLPKRVDRSIRIKNAIDNPYVHDNFDLIIIDTQGAGGALQEAAAFAANVLLSPISPDILSAREFLSGTMELINRLDQGKSLGLVPGHMKAVVYKMDHTRNAKVIAQEIKNSFLEMNGRVSMLNTVIPAAKAYTESATSQIPVHCHEVKSANRADSAFIVMHKLAWELIPDAKIDLVFGNCFGMLDVTELEMIIEASSVGQSNGLSEDL